MTGALSQHRKGIVLVVAAAIAWSTAPFFTRLLAVRFLDHPVLARIVRRQHDRDHSGAAARPERPARFYQDGQKRLAGRIAVDTGHGVLHPVPATDKRLECRDHHRDGTVRHRRARLDLASGSRRACGPRWQASWRSAASRSSSAARASAPTFSGLALAGIMTVAIAAMTVIVRQHRNTSMVAAAALSNILGCVVSIPFAHGIAAVTGIRPVHFRDVRVLPGRAGPHSVHARARACCRPARPP